MLNPPHVNLAALDLRLTLLGVAVVGVAVLGVEELLLLRGVS